MKQKSRKRAPHSYSADRPIHSKKDDLLGRAGFAERLAEDIQAWDGHDSLVIALYGAWGSGKTSVKNMLLEALRTKRKRALNIIDFNPWQFSGTGGIALAFFRELGVMLRRTGAARDVEKRTKKLHAYAAGLALGGTAIKSIGSLMPLLGLPGGPLVEAAGAGMKGMASASREGAEALKAKSEADAKSLHDLKEELSSMLIKFPRPLLVVIDDIDRLTTDEILQVFQLVKANADFPNVIYLLLFERSVVASALGRISEGRGLDFLEKIVQVGFHIPHASPRAVEKVLFNGLDSHVEQAAVLKHWDKQRWSELYVDGIKQYFQNLRHVYRFLASFAFHVRQHRKGNSFEVNPVDLIGLESLRVFEPAVYERLPSAKRILTRDTAPDLFDELKQDVVDQIVDQIVSHAARGNADSVKNILMTLFPPITSAFSGREGVSRHKQEWLRGLRVCHLDFFDKYFTLTVGTHDLSQEELDRLLHATSNHEVFVLACNGLKLRGLLETAFERLDAYKEHIPLENMPALVRALCDMSDEFPERQPGLFTQDLNSYAWRVVFFGLQREADPKRRFAVLKEAFIASLGMVLPTEVVSLDERVKDQQAKVHDFLVEEADLEILKQICVEKFRQASKTKSFRQHPRLRVFLWRWSAWASQDEVQRWVAEHTQTVTDGIWLLTVLMGEMHSWGSEHKIRYYIELRTIERFINTQSLVKILEHADQQRLSKREKTAVREFRRALARREAGQPDDAFRNEHEAFDPADDNK